MKQFLLIGLNMYKIILMMVHILDEPMSKLGRKSADLLFVKRQRSSLNMSIFLLNGISVLPLTPQKGTALDTLVSFFQEGHK